MPAPPPDARSFHGRVTRVEPCGDDGVILALRPEIELGPVRASRFFMVKRDDRVSPFIPRPFSIYRQSEGEIEFLIKVMGRGTRALADANAGQALRLIGPLGNGWPVLAPSSEPLVMLAGGVGSAPFYMAIEQALTGSFGGERWAPESLTYIDGAATKGLLYDLDAFRDLGIPVHAATDDGSEGFHGNTLQLFDRLIADGALPDRVKIFACGPDPMLHAVERLTRERKLEAWLSLETLMGCGVGICNGCPVDTRASGPLGGWPNAKCCVEGPVFSVDAITLDGPGAHGSPSAGPVTCSPEPEHVPARGRSGN